MKWENWRESRKVSIKVEHILFASTALAASTSPDVDEKSNEILFNNKSYNELIKEVDEEYAKQGIIAEIILAIRMVFRTFTLAVLFTPMALTSFLLLLPSRRLKQIWWNLTLLTLSIAGMCKFFI